ncbi:hypothetical protein [Desulfocurvus sp.]|jgi:hypothetical protein|uniref:hypothetical protein n=1 Tax=Desulfocurvus sp. TaxID=2871698 RepID=UPI0025C46DF3|nr:hypothetical protein [Desulfocurvus sp.]MCK9241553.1 hypothetical protein [Desulfocurvus sp.]
MTEDTVIDLGSLDAEELLGRMEGGLYALLSSSEDYADLFKVAAALGIKDFVTARLGHLDKGRLLALFEDGEQALSLFIRHAVEKGLLEPDDEEGQE